MREAPFGPEGTGSAGPRPGETVRAARPGSIRARPRRGIGRLSRAHRRRSGPRRAAFAFVDLPGHGISDRPADLGYTLEDHADALASALDTAGRWAPRSSGTAWAGRSPSCSRYAAPIWSPGWCSPRPTSIPRAPRTAGSSGISAYTEDAYMNGGGFGETLERVGPVWRATMRLADPTALHRSARGLVRGTEPTMRRMLVGLDIQRTYVVGEQGDALTGRDELVAAGVVVMTVPGAGHNMMFDDPSAFAAAIAAPGGRRGPADRQP